MRESNFGTIDSAIASGLEDGEKGSEIWIEDNSLRVCLSIDLAHVTKGNTKRIYTRKTSIAATRTHSMEVMAALPAGNGSALQSRSDK